MTGVVFALCAAVFWAMSAVSVRFGLRHMPATLGTFLSLLSGLVMMSLAVALFRRDQLGEVTLVSVGVFALVGLLNFIFGRYLNFLSISHLGVTRATPVLASTPLFAAILAVLFLGEGMNGLTLLGTGFVIAGVYLVLKP